MIKRIIFILLLLTGPVWAVTYTADTPAKIIGYCNTADYPRAAAGDTINIPAGTYNLAGTALAPVAGVIIVGADEATTIIQGRIITDNNDIVNTTQVSNLTFAIKNLETGTQLSDGLFTLTDVTVDGSAVMAVGNALNITNTTNKCQATLTRVTVNNGGQDCISASGAAFASTSWVKLYDCVAHTPGGAGIDNCLTTHNGVAMYDYKGYYHTPNGGKTIATDASTTILELRGTVVQGRIECTKAFGVSRTSVQASDCFLVYEGAYNCYSDASGYTGNAYRLSGAAAELVSSVGLGDGTSSSGILSLTPFNQTIKNCFISGFSAVNQADVYCDMATASASLTIVNCYLGTGYRGLELRSNGGGVFTLNLYNNIFTGSTINDIRYYTSGGGTFVQNSGYNCLPGTSSNYTESGDEPDINAESQIYADYWPIEGGNCDIGKGHPTTRALGTPDLYGRPKLRAYEDTIGPIYPQRPNVRNNLIPLVRQGRDLISDNFKR